VYATTVRLYQSDEISKRIISLFFAIYYCQFIILRFIPFTDVDKGTKECDDCDAQREAFNGISFVRDRVVKNDFESERL
jgi:hypothetical protein